MSEKPKRRARALVTGASGFLGSNLCRRLVAEGMEVHATSRQQHHGNGSVRRWWQTDLTSPVSVQGIVREVRPDFVFHLAGEVSADPGMHMVVPTLRSFLDGTVNLLEAVTQVGCERLVVTGSLTEPQSANTELIPASPYAAAKVASTAYARMFHFLYRTPVVIVRPFMTYGPGQRKEKIIPHVILSLMEGTSPKLSSGRWQADWVFVDDVIEGFVRAATRPNVEGRTTDLGTGKLTSTREVVTRLVELVRPGLQPAFGALPDRPAEQLRLADTASAWQHLGWRAKTSLEVGLASTVAWYHTQFNNSSKG